MQADDADALPAVGSFGAYSVRCRRDSTVCRKSLQHHARSAGGGGKLPTDVGGKLPVNTLIPAGVVRRQADRNWTG